MPGRSTVLLYDFTGIFTHACTNIVHSTMTDSLRHPPQGAIYTNQKQPGPLSDPAWSLRYEQCDGANGVG